MNPRGRGRGRGRGRSSLFNGEKLEFLSKNSKVEVTINEEGFKGAWFKAKIVNDSSTTTPAKRKNQVFVQYDDLLDSDESNHVGLFEAVETFYIRPLPPPPDQIYEPYDVVDAFHRDGWWKGVVTKVEVLEENKRSYNVMFENPDEEFTFCSKDLRFHLDWINGDQWVKPPKQLKLKDNYHSFKISGENPKFCKIIVQDTIEEGRLAIPRKFMKIYGDCLSERIIIKVAEGTIWKMELLKGDNYEAWLQEGWKEFSEHYSLKHGHLLLFKYQYNSNFVVFIFDTTFLEIHYPRIPDSIPNSEQNLNQLNEFVEVEDPDSENLEFEGISNEPKGRRMSQGLEAADKFSSINPWFKVVLKSYNGKIFSLSMSIVFIREHMDINSETVILKIEGCKTCWTTKLIVYKKDSSARLSAGWSAFVKDNCLKDKDVCIFESVARNELKVHIFRHLSL